MYIKGKGHFESDGKTYICSQRQMVLARARRAGFEGDSATFTRLLIEGRINRQAMNEAWRAGKAMAQATEATQ